MIVQSDEGTPKDRDLQVVTSRDSHARFERVALAMLRSVSHCFFQLCFDKTRQEAARLDSTRGAFDVAAAVRGQVLANMGTI